MNNPNQYEREDSSMTAAAQQWPEQESEPAAEHELPAPVAPSTQPIEAAVPAVPDVVYHGYQEEAGGSVIAVETMDGEAIGLLYHHIRHSPDGFQWGYAGSGPAETARCLLLDAVDDNRCSACLGTRLIVLTGDEAGKERPFDVEHDSRTDEMVFRCVECDDGFRNLPYQEFKFGHVSAWKGEWRMRRSDIRDWLLVKGVAL